jgi:polysaccharide export outer membrane protein
MLVAAACAQQASRAGGASGANLPAQAIGPNDLIDVSVYDAPEFSGTVRVGADGVIRLPMLKNQTITAEGLLPAEVESAIAAALKEGQMMVDPFVTVTIAEYHSRPITVEGAVKSPITFQAEGPTTLLQALARAGGLQPTAASEILVSRTEKGTNGEPESLTMRVSARGLIDSADPALNLKLTGGEEIRVPEAAKIYVVGNVKKPGAVPIQDSAETTVLQTLALAEGLAPFAGKTAYVYRADATGKKNEIAVPLDKIMRRKAADVPLMANDIFYVPDNKSRRMTLAALEKVVAFGTTAGATALIYSKF